MKKTLLTLVCAVLCLAVITGILFSCLQVAMNDRDWYYDEYVRLGTAQEIGISEEDCTRAIYTLIDYMEGRVDSIQLDVVENGVSVQMYNDQEIAHMADVKVLYQSFRTLRNIGIGLFVILICAFVLLRNDAELKLTVPRGFVWASIAFAAIIAALGVWVLTDFTSFWVEFHHMFFTNDLWLMDYYTCRMIRICPEQLFNDIVVRFGSVFAIIMAALLALSMIAQKRVKKA